jgi:hypothetical protein
LGYLPPVRSLRPLTSDPSGIPIVAHALGCDSIGQSSRDVRVSFTALPAVSAPVSRPEAPLLGFLLPLQRTRWRESTGCWLLWQPTPSRCCRDLAGRSHSVGYGTAPRFSQPPSGFFLPLPPYHFQAGGTPGVRPFRDSILSHSPSDSSPPACPLDVDPAVHSLVLGEEAAGALAET